jgi:hypothetical protein
MSQGETYLVECAVSNIGKISLYSSQHISLGQGCRTYGTHARSDKREDFLGSQHSLLYQFLPRSTFLVLKIAYVFMKAKRLYMIIITIRMMLRVNDFLYKP